MVRRGWEKTIAFAIRSVDPVLTKEELGEVNRNMIPRKDGEFLGREH